jgi:hypothetical protein
MRWQRAAVAALALAALLAAAAANSLGALQSNRSSQAAGAPAPPLVSPNAGSVHVGRVMDANRVVAYQVLAGDLTVAGDADIRGTVNVNDMACWRVTADVVKASFLTSPTGTILVNGDLVVSNNRQAAGGGGRRPKPSDGAREKGGDDKPKGGEGKPKGGEGKPKGQEDKPKGGEGKPEGQEDKPKGGEGKPKGGEGKPKGQEGKTRSANDKKDDTKKDDAKKDDTKPEGGKEKSAGEKKDDAKPEGDKPKPADKPADKPAAATLLEEHEARFLADEDELDAMEQEAEPEPVVHATAFIAEDVVLGGVKQWRLVRHDSFDEAVEGWSLLETSSCLGSRDRHLGGHCKIAHGRVSKRFENLPPHSQVRVTGRYHFIDDWQGETAFLQLGDEFVWSDRAQRAAPGQGLQMCGSAKYPETRMSLPVDVVQSHSASFLEVSFGSHGLDPAQDPCERSFGVDDVMVYVR